MTGTLLERAVIGCGIAHIMLCLGSLYIPKALQWRTHLRVLQPLLRQMFWTYAGYILVTNLSFGIVSILGSEELLAKSFLARSVTVFISVYWFARIGIQFFYFDRSHAPKGMMYTIAEILLVSLFVIFSLTYFVAFLYNCGWL